MNTTTQRSSILDKIRKKDIILFLLALSVAWGFALVAAAYGGNVSSDFHTIKIATLTGNYGERTWYPYPFYWIFYPFAILPHPVGMGLWSFISATGFMVAARKFGGNPLGLSLSVPFLFVILSGQVEGLIVWGMVLAFSTNIWISGLGIFILTLKPQVSVLICIFVLLQKRDWRILIIPILIYLMSFIEWGWWIPEWIGSLSNAGSTVSEWNIVKWLWPWGLVTLPLIWYYRQSLGVWVTVQSLSVPYLAKYSIAMLFAVNPFPLWLNLSIWVWFLKFRYVNQSWIIFVVLILACINNYSTRLKPSRTIE